MIHDARYSCFQPRGIIRNGLGEESRFRVVMALSGGQQPLSVEIESRALDVVDQQVS